jgi:UDP-N-acetylglucosamine acyltransferase
VNIHPTAIIEEGAELADDVKVGPYCVVGPHVRLAEGVELFSHVAVAGHTSVGPRTRIWPFCSIGHQPQDLKYKGEETRLEIGADCLIREHVTMSTGTIQGHRLTRIGDRCMFMMASHVGHDCQIGNNVIMANNATLGGHVHVGDFVFMGGLSAVHQFVRIGAHAIVGGMTGVERDVIPFGSAIGDRADLGGLNLVGLKRRGFSRETIHALRSAYRMIFFGPGSLMERTARAGAAYPDVEAVQQVVAFIQTDSTRSFCTPRGD